VWSLSGLSTRRRTRAAALVELDGRRFAVALADGAATELGLPLAGPT
jgi:hypothetical protein